jgi:hypothetical protein
MSTHSTTQFCNHASDAGVFAYDVGIIPQKICLPVLTVALVQEVLAYSVVATRGILTTVAPPDNLCAR